MQNCPNCGGKKWLKTDKKSEDGIRYWRCFRCPTVVLGDRPFERQLPRTLYIDVETSLTDLYGSFGLKVHGEYLNPQLVRHPFYIICWSAMWIDTHKLYSRCVTQEAALAWTDKDILRPLFDLMDMADVVAGHNVNFDIKKINMRLLKNGFDKPEKFKTIDTLKIARSKFAFESNRLDDICIELGFRPKIDMCLADWIEIKETGNPCILRKMQKYNKQDVTEGAKVLESLMGWSDKPLDFAARIFPKEPKDKRYGIMQETNKEI